MDYDAETRDLIDGLGKKRIMTTLLFETTKGWKWQMKIDNKNAIGGETIFTTRDEARLNMTYRVACFLQGWQNAMEEREG